MSLTQSYPRGKRQKGRKNVGLKDAKSKVVDGNQADSASVTLQAPINPPIFLMWHFGWKPIKRSVAKQM
jgi:hypothetical protein